MAAEEETSQIQIERVHCLGKIREDKNHAQSLPKFRFHKDKERILSHARTLTGTNYRMPFHRIFREKSLKYRRV